MAETFEVRLARRIHERRGLGYTTATLSTQGVPDDDVQQVLKNIGQIEGWKADLRSHGLGRHVKVTMPPATEGKAH